MPLGELKVELVDAWGGDRNAAEAAWASSTDKEKLSLRTDSDVRRVVTGVVHLHHDTPKERLWTEWFLTVPIFVERQLDKYRLTVQYQDFIVEYSEGAFGRHGITQNELSGRYRTIPERPFGLPRDVAAILAKSGMAVESKASAEEYQRDWLELLHAQHDEYHAKLQQLRLAEKLGQVTNAEYKRAREVLRGILGTGYLTDMRLVMNMNAFEHIINQRLARDAQLESRVVAALLVDAVQKAEICPTMIDELIKANNWQPLLDEALTALREDS